MFLLGSSGLVTPSPQTLLLGLPVWISCFQAALPSSVDFFPTLQLLSGVKEAKERRPFPVLLLSLPFNKVTMFLLGLFIYAFKTIVFNERFRTFEMPIATGWGAGPNPGVRMDSLWGSFLTSPRSFSVAVQQEILAHHHPDSLCSLVGGESSAECVWSWHFVSSDVSLKQGTLSPMTNHPNSQIGSNMSLRRQVTDLSPTHLDVISRDKQTPDSVYHNTHPYTSYQQNSGCF